LEHGGFLQPRQLDHGGVVLDLTSEGQVALRDPGKLDDLIGPAEGAARKPSQEDPEKPEGDEALFQTLRTWRLEQARAQEVPPYVVFHDSHLRAIAAHCPITLEALSNLKGVGPIKLEKYGAMVIELVCKHLGRDLQSHQNHSSAV
jgi:ATP-dependent DNA helicase RecQ